jgi:MtN3 and saliva related transmembrane protein
MSTVIAMLGVLAAIGTTGSWLPQVVRTFRTRSARDFSWGYMVLFGVGVACWLAYGLLRQDPALAGANVVTLVLFLGIVAVKWQSERGGRGTREPVR